MARWKRKGEREEKRKININVNVGVNESFISKKCNGDDVDRWGTDKIRFD